MNKMGKKILTHTITASSFDELSELSHAWLKRMQGKIEVLDAEGSKPGEASQFYTITYYILDNRHVEFTIEELQYIEEKFHDAVKDRPENTVLQSIEKKAAKALGWE